MDQNFLRIKILKCDLSRVHFFLDLHTMSRLITCSKTVMAGLLLQPLADFRPIDWMSTYSENLQLQIYTRDDYLTPFCFLRVPDCADRSAELRCVLDVRGTLSVSSMCLYFKFYNSIQNLQRAYPDIVPSGTILVLRTHPDLTQRYVSAISVRVDEDIVWSRHQLLCRVSHRGIRSDYHVTSSFFNRARELLPLCVPVPLLLLEADWPLPPISHKYTLYGSPRLQRGPQVRIEYDNSPLFQTHKRLLTHPSLIQHLQTSVTITLIALPLATLSE